MTKQTKFRVWQEHKKKMIPWEELVGTWTFEDIQMINEGKSESVLMRNTGLTDKDGKEIYFNNIIRFKFLDPDDRYQGTAIIVETLNGGAGIMFDYDKDRDEVWACGEGGMIEEVWDDPDLWDIEVIGDIYQNPELLK